jgi:hyaluronan synthase
MNELNSPHPRIAQGVGSLAPACAVDGAWTEPPADAWDWLLRLTITLAVAGIFYTTMAGRFMLPLAHAINAHGWSHRLMRPSLLWMIMGSVMLAFRTVLWFRYRPTAPAQYAAAPSLTVVIPAYNEGAMVARTIESVAGADYPPGRLEIMVVDDGSRDDTWSHIERAAAHHPQLVTTLRFPQNRGKRAALEQGFRNARGEIVVTIDSDSIIERDTLLAIAGPFRDPKVGAVAGKVAVYNRRAGIIPRMLHVRFVLSFDMLRAAQSTFGTVYCCPGALSAYRLSVVREVIDAWMGQRFLGVPSTYGEDRALTNFILAKGYDTVFQRSAVVHTVVPVTYSKLCKMYLRWDRSYVREEIRFARIVWKRPWRSRLVAIVDSLMTVLRYPAGYAILAMLLAAVASEPMTLLRVLFAIGVMSTFYMLYYLRSERSWDLVYGILYAYFSFFALFWIFPYALLTLRARSWMTR